MVIAERKPISVNQSVSDSGASKGMSWENREKRRAGILNSEKHRMVEERQSVVWNQVRPLYERGLLNAEIEMITSLSHRQIVRSIGQNKYRPAWNMAETSNDNSRRIGAWKLRKERNRPISEDRKRSIKFAKFLFDSGLITKNTSMWRELNKLYQLHQRQLPENNFDKLRLELFFTAISVTESNLDPTLLNKYRELVDKMTSLSFKTKLLPDEEFIKSKICDVWKYDGEDGKGLFYYNRHGGRSYTLDGEDEEGKPLFATSKSLQKRRTFRQNGNITMRPNSEYKKPMRLKYPDL